MNPRILRSAGAVAVVGTALAAVFLTRSGYAQAQADADDPAIRAVVGTRPVAATDVRFRPLASFVLEQSDAAEIGTKKKSRRIFIHTARKNFFEYRIYKVPGGLSQSGEPRPLTPAELATMEALFASNVGRSKVTVSADGITGEITPAGSGVNPDALAKLAQDRARAKAQAYGEAARSLSN